MMKTKSRFQSAEPWSTGSSPLTELPTSSSPPKSARNRPQPIFPISRRQKRAAARHVLHEPGRGLESLSSGNTKVGKSLKKSDTLDPEESDAIPPMEVSVLTIYFSYY